MNSDQSEWRLVGDDLEDSMETPEESHIRDKADLISNICNITMSSIQSILPDMPSSRKNSDT